MKKKDKNYYTFLILFFLIILLIPKSFASESINFLSLKNNEVNVRVGPSKKYPIEAELSLHPQNTVKIKESDSNQLINLLTLLEDHEDVQKVYTNLEIEK